MTGKKNSGALDDEMEQVMREDEMCRKCVYLL